MNIFIRTFTLLFALLLSIGLYSQNKIAVSAPIVSMESLLDEMVSPEASVRIPNPYYTCRQESSYDRRSISPNKVGWFANDDGFGVMRIDTIEGRFEKVMFDEIGAGAITRIWITTLNKKGTWRFYFDGAAQPGWIIPAYDLMQINIPSLGRGLLQPHTSYEPEGRGGNTLFLPIPYAEGCKITFEDALGVNPTPKYYGINFRKYSEGTKVETFSKEVVRRNEKKIAEVDKLLLNPKVTKKGKILSANKIITPSEFLRIDLPKGENAVYEIKIKATIKDSSQFSQLMREIIFSTEFDGKQTSWVPLSDFSGGGIGAPFVKSWYLDSDGKGAIISRWLMPYKKSGTLKLENISSTPIDLKMEARVSTLAWDERSLYFHCSWRQERGIYIHNNPNESNKCSDWNFATIDGKGIYMGDLLSLFNHAPKWYGEGDEKIWVDNEAFPSHFGTGTEDYYNSSWAPVYPFHTPFGGAPRADLPSSHGYNAFFRTRNLDGIPFEKSLKFDIEMIGWEPGFADCATTTYWYGDFDSQMKRTSGIDEAKRKLVKEPENPAKYKIAHSIELEEAKIIDKSTSLKIEKQFTHDFHNGKWSSAAHLLGKGSKVGEFLEFEFDNLKNGKYEIILYATHANDYGILSFEINGKPILITFDGFDKDVTNSKPIDLGFASPISEKIRLKVKISGTNDQTTGPRYYLGLDCIQLLPIRNKQ